jgi:hypothetical protein
MIVIEDRLDDACGSSMTWISFGSSTPIMPSGSSVPSIQSRSPFQKGECTRMIGMRRIFPSAPASALPSARPASRSRPASSRSARMLHEHDLAREEVLEGMRNILEGICALLVRQLDVQIPRWDWHLRRRRD